MAVLLIIQGVVDAVFFGRKILECNKRSYKR